jgi:hypothetical protein
MAPHRGLWGTPKFPEKMLLSSTLYHFLAFEGEGRVSCGQ